MRWPRRMVHIAAKARRNCGIVILMGRLNRWGFGVKIGRKRAKLSHTKPLCASGLRGPARNVATSGSCQWHIGCVRIWHIGALPIHAFGGLPTLTCWPAGPRMRSGIVVALPLTAVSSQYVIGSFEARFFCAQRNQSHRAKTGLAATRSGARLGWHALATQSMPTLARERCGVA